MKQREEVSGSQMGEREGEKLERESEGKASGGEIVMDTPERGRITTPLSKFEDSPVFNYINNLSPLETVKPVRISQTLNSYSFSSVPSIFTSPHVSSLKETTFLRRYSVSSPSNRTCSSENGNKVCSNEGFSHKSDGQKGVFDPGGCIEDGLNKRKVENRGLQNQNYGPNDSAVTCHDTVASSNDQSKEGGSFGWEAISDAGADFLIFESPDNADPFKGSFLKPLDSETRLHVSEETQIDIKRTENTLVQTSEGQSNVTEAAGDVLALTCVNNQVAEVSNEVIANDSASNLPRGIRRRCLVYDMGGARRKFLDDGATSSSSSKCHVTSSKNHLILANPDTSSSRCIVPGIGLHLNALARTSNACTANYQEALATPRQLINDLSSNAAPDLSVNTQETINQSLVLNSVDRDVGSVDVGVHVTEDAYQLSGFVGSDDPNQSNQKKRKVENGGETESCKRCNCKKSKCLKLYCECFAAGVYCVEPCSCQDCFNKPIHEETVLATRKQIESRNPLAFAPKVIRTTDLVPETADELSSTPASARHKRGCNCKKSGCLKKYCECYQGGVGCSINCRCEGCKNAFGRKDGSHALLSEGEGEVTEKHEKSVVDRNSSKQIIQNNAEPNQDSVLPETPMHSNRASIQHPFSSKNKPPRSFLSTGSSSSTLYGRQKFGMPAFLQPHQKIEKRVPTSLENEIPEILQSPISGFKSSSPKSKRVSPPHTNIGSSLSPARRSSRKLILQSIPSFPSLKD